MECRPPEAPELPVCSRHAPSKDACAKPRLEQRCESPTEPPHRACPAPHTRVSAAAAPEPGVTRRSLLAQRLVIVMFAAGAFGRRKLAICSPGKQPGFHVLVRNVMPRRDLPLCLADLGQHSLLVCDVGFNRIGNEKIRASPGNCGQFGKPLLDRRLQPDAEGCASCVRHEHMLSRSTLLNRGEQRAEIQLNFRWLKPLSPPHPQSQSSTGDSAAHCVTAPAIAPPDSYFHSPAATTRESFHLPTAPESCPREENCQAH